MSGKARVPTQDCCVAHLEALNEMQERGNLKASKKKKAAPPAAIRSVYCHKARPLAGSSPSAAAVAMVGVDSRRAHLVHSM